MKIILPIALFAAIFVCAAQAQDCCIVGEVFKIVSKAIVKFVPDKSHHKTYCGCAKAFIIGDPSDCDNTKFKLPEAKICEDVMNHVEMKSKCKEHNIKKYKTMIENAIYSNGGDCDEICEKMPEEGDKFLIKMEKMQKEGAGDAKTKLDQICKGNVDKCNEIKEMPKEMEDYVVNEMAPCFKPLITIIKNTMKSKTAPAMGAAGQGIELLFGGGEFGIKVSKCVNEVIAIATKMGKTMAGR